MTFEIDGSELRRTYLDRHVLGPGDVARLLAAIAPNLPPETRAQLRRRVAQSIAAPTGAELVQARLGLLCDVVAADPDGLPSTGDYERERQRRLKRYGELWPDHETLIDLYHHWFNACRAAERRNEGPHKRVPRSNKHLEDGERTPWTRAEVIDSLLRFRAKYGTLPRAWELRTWSQATRRGAKARAAGVPRNVPPDKVEALFGGLDEALRETERRWQEIRGEAPSDPPASAGTAAT